MNVTEAQLPLEPGITLDLTLTRRRALYHVENEYIEGGGPHDLIYLNQPCVAVGCVRDHVHVDRADPATPGATP